MANVGAYACSDLATLLSGPCTGGWQLSLSVIPKPGVGPPYPRCLLPAEYDNFAYASGAWTDFNYDPTQQIWQTDPAAGYPSFSMWCDATDDNSQVGPIVRQINQDETTQDFVLSPAGGSSDGTLTRFEAPLPGQANCMLMFNIRCKGDSGDGL